MRRVAFLVATVVPLSACSTASAPASADRLFALKILSDTGRRSTVGAAVSSPVVVQAVDANDRGLPGRPVTFSPLVGSGTVGSASTTTDGNGRANTTWTLDTLAGQQSLRAEVTDASSGLVLDDTITVTAIAGVGKTLMKTAGDSQATYPGYALPDSLAVTLVDQYANRVAGATVTWSVSGGNGKISPSTSATNASGVATARWTMGATAGANSATAAVTGLPSITFHAAAGGNPHVRIQIAQKHDTARALGDTLKLSATVVDSTGTPIAGAVIVWSTPDPTLATVTSTGALSSSVSEKAVGTAHVIASYNGSADTSLVMLKQVPVKITFPDSFPTIVIHQSAALNAQVVDSNSAPIPGLAINWQVGDPTIVSIGANNTASGLMLGSTAITATTPLIVGQGFTARLSVTRQAFASVQFVQIVNGQDHVCALSSLGEAYCWGVDDPSVSNGVSCFVVTNIYDGCPGPIPASGGLTFTQLAASFSATCGLVGTGAVYCWGSNTVGGSSNQQWAPYALSVNPTLVAGAPAFASITAAGNFACGLTTAGGAYCWGTGTSGQLGNGSTTGSATPVPVSGGLTFTQVAAGSNFACGLATGGAAYCWGDNTYGELGNGDQSVGSCTYTGFAGGPMTYPCSPTPVAVAGHLSFTALSASTLAVCGLTAAGDMYCWGENYEGVLGDGVVSALSALPCTGLPNCSLTPAPVIGGIQFTTMGNGPCALVSSGAAYCWGSDSLGNVGNGQTYVAPITTPTAVVGGLRFTAIAPTPNVGWASCGIATNRSAYCWGGGFDGLLGSKGVARTGTPTLVVHP